MRLRKRREFQRVAKESFRLNGEWIILTIRFTNRSLTRLGITVSKRYGSANVRNRFKRIVREAFRLSYPIFPTPVFDLVVQPRSKAKEADSLLIQNELLQLIEKALGFSGLSC